MPSSPQLKSVEKMAGQNAVDLKKKRQEMIVGVAKNTPALAKAEKHLVQYAPVIAQACVFMELTVFPTMMLGFQKGQQGWKILKPHVTGKNMEDLVPCLCGLALCFFGGMFPLVIASVEAFRLVGLEGMKSAICALWGEGEKALEAHKKDEDADENDNGIKDVLEMNPAQLVAHKAYIVLKVVDPDKVSQAFVALNCGLLAVLANLKMGFARAVTLGTTLGDALKKQVSKYVVPFITELIPPETHKWVPAVADWLCKVVAIFIAMSLQTLISGFHSAIRGGRMVGLYGVKYGQRMGYLKDFDPNKSQLDEMVVYGCAGLGFLFQLYMAFSLTFPFNLLFLPVSICEGVLGTLVMWI